MLESKLYKIGVIAGNFDVIHPGYIYMFTEMKMLCENVIILLQTDPTIERPEKIKPILSVEERADILLSLRQVDNIVKYTTESELYQLLKAIKPSVRFLGDDYIGRVEFTGSDLNIPIHYLNRSHGWSTTKFKKLIAQSL
jgi:glycerol-3-phosphate cytidylyltransferase